MVWDNDNLVQVLKQNGVVVMPTDTLYGIVGRAQNKNVVERIYKIRKRASEKPCLILIGEIGELEKFSIVLTESQRKRVEEYREPTSFIVDCPEEALAYLHRGTQTLAFRLPAPQSLRDLLLKVGPLIAPSANPEGLPPAQTIREAKEYFKNLVGLYVDGGMISGKPSKIIKLHKDGKMSIIRQ